MGPGQRRFGRQRQAGDWAVDRIEVRVLLAGAEAVAGYRLLIEAHDNPVVQSLCAHLPRLGWIGLSCHPLCSTDKKTKELLMLALASVFRCPHCTEAHIEAALEIGISKEEITEALLIAALEGAGTQLAWAKEIYLKHLGNYKE